MSSEREHGCDDHSGINKQFSSAVAGAVRKDQINSTKIIVVTSDERPAEQFIKFNNAFLLLLKRIISAYWRIIHGSTLYFSIAGIIFQNLNAS